jgi:nitroimidazol reductase NimA-like FMN-containing flavoprotein (pyridoxamine 5'-phosphate oxidase superfamily)
MKDKAVGILDQYRVMGIATVRPDGWPQATMVSYANEDILVYFVVSRRRQKFANIGRDDRVSLIMGRDSDDPTAIKALSIAARASRSPRSQAARACDQASFGTTIPASQSWSRQCPIIRQWSVESGH